MFWAIFGISSRKITKNAYYAAIYVYFIAQLCVTLPLKTDCLEGAGGASTELGAKLRIYANSYTIK
jgi:hypothetical protein